MYNHAHINYLVLGVENCVGTNSCGRTNRKLTRKRMQLTSRKRSAELKKFILKKTSRGQKTSHQYCMIVCGHPAAHSACIVSQCAAGHLGRGKTSLSHITGWQVMQWHVKNYRRNSRSGAKIQIFRKYVAKAGGCLHFKSSGTASSPAKITVSSKFVTSSIIKKMASFSLLPVSGTTTDLDTLSCAHKKRK